MPKQPPKYDPNTPLPDNIEDCHKLIRELFARIAELEKQLSRRNRQAFGRKSAKVDAALLTGTGKVIHNQATDELNAEKQRLNVVPENKHGGGRTVPPPHLKTRKEEHRIPASEIPCPCCGTATRDHWL
jgi:hypothetical protein